MIKFSKTKDWNYGESCGCQVTLHHESKFFNYRLAINDDCSKHGRWFQTDARDALVQRAREASKKYGLI